MKILDWYIGRAVAISSLLVMFILLALFAVTLFVGELEDVDKGTYGVLEAAQFVALTMPRLAYELFPSVALLGCMVGLGMLANNSELLAMRAAGVSLNRIVGSVLKTGFLLMLIATVLGEFIAPMTEKIAHQLRFAAVTTDAMLYSEKGFWARDGSQFIHIRNVFDDGSLGDISIYEVGDKQDLRAITQAGHAYYQGDAWMMQGIVRSNVSPDGVVTERKISKSWPSLLKPDLVDVVAVNPEFLSFMGLYKYTQYLHENNLEAARYEQKLWRKIFSPLATGVMVLLAIPFIFGSLRAVPIGQRILKGALVGVVFYIANQFSGFLGLIYHVNSLATVAIPTVVFFILAVYLMRRVL